MELTSHYSSPLGSMTMASNGEALTGLWFDRQRSFCSGLSSGQQEKQLPVFEETKRWLDLYFSGRAPDIIPPLAPEGSDFRQNVWKILLTIPWNCPADRAGIRHTADVRAGSRRSGRT